MFFLKSPDDSAGGEQIHTSFFNRDSANIVVVPHAIARYVLPISALLDPAMRQLDGVVGPVHAHVPALELHLTRAADALQFE